MLNMIKADFYRIFKGKSIYIALIILLSLISLSCFTMSPGHIGIVATDDTSDVVYDEELNQKLSDTNSIIETRRLVKEYGSYPIDKLQLGANINLYYFFIIIVAIVLVTDLSTSTAKNTLSSAISRKRYYASKLITCLLLGTGLILINNYVSYFLNLIMNGSKFSSGILEITKLTLLQLPILYGIISLLVCLGFCFKKSANFNSITIPLIILIQLIIMGIASLFHFDASQLLNYELQYILANLVTNPTTAYLIKTTLLGLIYIVGFTTIGYTVFKKSEIK
ncbi:MAG TPA: hypothetical protein IAB56_07210 [Candidatus Scybalousia intestinigallinarum]|nr:hypothetical protein [Candidatus Scybalousia intestinigallinarum]